MDCSASPCSHFFIPFFPSWKQTGAERESGQARAFFARRAQSEAERLDAAPELRTLSAKKWEISPRFFVFKTLTRARRAVAAQQPGVEDFSS